MAKKKCKYIFRGKAYTEEEFKSLLANGLLGEMVDTGKVKAKFAIPTIKRPKSTADAAFRMGQAVGSAETKAKVERNKDIEAAKSNFRTAVNNYEKGFAAGARQSAKSQESARKQLDKAIKQFLSEKVLKNISEKDAKRIVAAAQKVRTAEDLMKFDDTVNEIVYGAEMKELIRQEDDAKKKEVAQGKKDQKNIKKKIRKAQKPGEASVLASDRDILKNFVALDPSKVSDIAEYNSIASAIKENITNPTVREGEVKKDNRRISNEDIEAYISRESEYIEENEKQRLAEENFDLVVTGELKPSSMTLQEMRDVIDELNEQEINENAAEEKRQALVDTVAPKVAALQFLKQEDEDGNVAYDQMSDMEKEVFDRIAKLDVENLSARELNAVNNIVENILTNQDFSNAGYAANLQEMQQNLEDLKQYFKDNNISAYPDLGKIKGIASSLDLLTEFITNNTKAAAKLQTLSGIQDMSSGYSRMNQWMEKTYFAPLRDLYKGKRALRNYENTVRRGMYAFMIQDKSSDVAGKIQEFERRKGLIEQSVDAMLRSDDKDTKKRGEVAKRVFDEMASAAVDPSELKIDKDNKAIVDFNIEAFGKVVDKLDETSRIYNNTSLELWNNYTPTGYETVKGEIDIATIVDPGKVAFVADNIDTKQSGTTIKRVNNKKLKEGQVVNMSFDNLMERKLRESMYEVETIKGRQVFAGMIKNKEFQGLIGGVNNSDRLKKSVVNMLNAQLRLTNPPEVEKMINGYVNILSAKGARVALASISQPLKQGPPVFMNTMANLGRDGGLFFSTPNGGDPELDNLFRFSSIRERKDTKGGIRFTPLMDETEKAKVKGAFANVGDIIGEVGGKVSDALFVPLTATDYWIARKSWIAYYAQYMKKNGAKVTDWKAEAANPNKDASAYAEQMVSRSQNVNDFSKQSQLMLRTGGVMDVMRNVLLPFSSFAVNQRARMTLDFQKLRTAIANGSEGQVSQAAKSLGATAAEIAAFNGIKIFFLYNATSFMAGLVLSAMGYEDDEIEEMIKYKTFNESIKRFAAESSVNFLAGGFGSMTEEQAKRGANYLAKYLGEEKDIIPIYESQGGVDWGSFGSYGILAGQVADAMPIAEAVITGKWETLKRGGFEPEFGEKDLSQRQRNLLTWYMVSNILSVVGVSDAELNTVMRKAKGAVERAELKEYDKTEIYYKKKQFKEDKKQGRTRPMKRKASR